MRNATLFLLALSLPSAATAVPMELSQQGRLFNTTGTPLTGTEDLSFSIYDTVSGGTALWDETQTAVPFDNGYYTVDLGSVDSLPATIFDGSELWLGITVGSGAELSGRLPLNSVPYAIHAGEAINVTGDITPSSITVNGTTIVDGTGAWVGAVPDTDVAALITAGDLAGVASSGDYSDLANTPMVISDLSCADGQIAKFVGGAWACADGVENTIGDNLLYAQDAQQVAPEDNAGYTTMNHYTAGAAGDLRIGFEAYIQSGGDWWAWEVLVDGTQAASGRYTQGVHSSNSQSVHAYRRYEVDLVDINAGSLIEVRLKASLDDGTGFGSGSDQNLYMKRFRVYSAAGGGSVNGAAVFRAGLNNSGAIEASNAGYANFTEKLNSHPDVFEVVTTGNYGIRFLKPGFISWQYDQDIITSGGNYPSVSASVGPTSGIQLISTTNGVWDAIISNGVAPVTPGDVLTFNYGCSGCTITAMDEGTWSYLNIMWNGQLE